MVAGHRKGDVALMNAIAGYLEALQRAFLGPDVSQVGPFFSTPLVIYSLVGVRVVRTHAELLSISTAYRDVLREKGIVQTRLLDVKQDAQQNKRCRVTARYQNLAANQDFVVSSVVRYFLLKDQDTYVIEMLEYIEPPISVEDINRLFH